MRRFPSPRLFTLAAVLAATAVLAGCASAPLQNTAGPSDEPTPTAQPNYGG